MQRRIGRLSRKGTSEELPELKEVAGEERCQIPVVAVEDVDRAVEDSAKNEEENTGRKRKTAQEEAAEKERAAQRQIMAIQELVDTERNYLKYLQICTVTIRGNLQKLQVGPLLTFVVTFHVIITTFNLVSTDVLDTLYVSRFLDLTNVIKNL